LMAEGSQPTERVDDPFGDMLGISFIAYGEGISRCELDIKKELISPRGSLHGGVISSVIDYGMGSAVYATLAEGEMCATIEMKIHFIKSPKSGRLVCDSRVIDRHPRIAIAEAELRNGDDLIAKGIGTFYIHGEWQPMPTVKE